MSLRTFVFAVALLAASAAGAQALVDPTRPPNAPVGGEAPEAVPGGTQLQSILISQRHKLAMINGTTVPVGGMVGEAKVVKITETEVTLQRGSETEVLKLYPGIEKQPTKRIARTSRKAAEQGRQ
jgi:MSHA biogenesis protein MshK